MKILFTGKGTSGSWAMRGVQLGAAMGATVRPKAMQGDHDIAVVVKRVPPEILPGLRRWAYDIVDAYSQPASYYWTRDQAIKWVRDYIAALKPNAVIWPTHKMREDCDTGLPGIVLPHHCRAGLVGRPTPGMVGYEGSPAYLGKWRRIIEAECRKKGLTFVVNPTDYVF